MSFLPCDPSRDEAVWLSNNIPVVFVASVLLCDPDQRVLIAQRPMDKPMGGLWELPGGKMQVNESPETCLVRELYEELGIKTHTSCFSAFTFVSHRYDRFHLLMPVFMCRNWQNPPRGKEGQTLKWISKKEIMRFDMPPANNGLKTQIRDL
jgi:8-oxo-dGTP diphosphatase